MGGTHKEKKGKEEEEMTEQTETSGVSLESDQKPEEEKLKEKLAQVENQYLRLLADFENFKKRTIQEKEDLYKYAAQQTIEILLPALDTFDYAREAVKPDSKVDKIVEDFNLVFGMLLKCLKDIGLETIDQTGIPFDPFYHEPLHQIPTSELPDHTVMQVFKKGYMLNKKIIRPALVSVSVKQAASSKEEPEEEKK